LRSTNRLRFQTEFSRICEDHRTLCGLRGPADLMERLHSPGGDPVGRNDILQALLVVAQSDREASQVATSLIILALWPGLDAVHGRMCRHYPGERHEIGGEILGRVTVGILNLDLAVVRKVAATLIMNTERDIHRGFKIIRQQTKDFVEWDDEKCLLVPGQPQAEDQHLSDTDWRQRLAPLLGRDTELFLRTIFLGETQAEAALALGMSHDAARKRHQRAMKKLGVLQKNSADLSHSAPRIGL
jgi:hypothetical protein